ncbi:hypothetical protein Dip510_001192 [Elusimicrobium posterum]|uniref:hypothetical protein n=1 Tax=Elusimicrobium posterum TaxID=3116653 RepID=UPI003C71FD47
MSKEEKKACCCSDNPICKVMKFMPHNWFSLRVLNVIFNVAFYAAIVYMIYQLSYVFNYMKIGMIPTKDGWQAAGMIFITIGFAAVALVTFAQITKALYKIKRATKETCCKDEKNLNNIFGEALLFLRFPVILRAYEQNQKIIINPRFNFCLYGIFTGGGRCT